MTVEERLQDAITAVERIAAGVERVADLLERLVELEQSYQATIQETRCGW